MTEFKNCRYAVCDLPGQCRIEGRCHHPKPMTEVDMERLELLEELYSNAHALSLGENWDNGTQGKTHGYKQKVKDSIKKIEDFDTKH